MGFNKNIESTRLGSAAQKKDKPTQKRRRGKVGVKERDIWRTSVGELTGVAAYYGNLGAFQEARERNLSRQCQMTGNAGGEAGGATKS